MRCVALWLPGIPIPAIILVHMFRVIQPLEAAGSLAHF